jgi:hypothetical protein
MGFVLPPLAMKIALAVVAGAGRFARFLVARCFPTVEPVGGA